jgi:L-threonine kinase
MALRLHFQQTAATPHRQTGSSMQKEQSMKQANQRVGQSVHTSVRQAAGTCGEFVQGCLDGEDFLVNCPVDLYSTAAAREHGGHGLELADPANHGKIAQAVDVVRRFHGVEPKHHLMVTSDIPRGKGMASSTADITAAVEAFCHSARLELDDTQFARVLTAVEPSDCVHFKGIAHVNHLTGEVFDVLPAPVSMRVLILDCGGQVDTVTFDRARARAVYRQNRTTLRAALELFKQGIRGGDLGAIAAAATISAELSQKILFKAPFSRLLQQSLACGALGVNCAHSGTVLGVLYRETDRLGAQLRQMVETHFAGGLRAVGDHRIIAGGRFAAR